MRAAKTSPFARRRRPAYNHGRMIPARKGPSMPIDWTPFVELVRTRQRFLLTTHVRPDGDGLGSMLALADVLEPPGQDGSLGRRQLAAAALRFPRPDRRVRSFELPGDEYRDAEAVIVLDTGTWDQLGDFGTFLRSLTVPKVVIDHHLTQDDLGAVRLVDMTAEATGRLAFEAIAALGGPLSAGAAHALFVAAGDGHRLVSPQQHDAGHVHPGGAAGRRPAPGRPRPTRSCSSRTRWAGSS